MKKAIVIDYCNEIVVELTDRVARSLLPRGNLVVTLVTKFLWNWQIA